MRRNILFFLSLTFFLLGLSSFASAEETMTITTYYPSPYGSYGQVSITDSGAKTATDYGLYLTNTATSSTASVNKYGMYISSTGTWNGASATNYGLYIVAPTGGTSNYGLIVAGGNVGIGTATPGWTLTINGTSWTTNNAWAGSDIRWKKNITSLQGSLNKVLQLKPVNFNWRVNEFPGLRFSEGMQIGFIAQDVEKIIPELVITDNNGYKGISYDRITSLLTAAMQEQQKEIEVLKSEISQLKERLKPAK